MLYLQVYILGTILSMQISFVGFQPVQSSEHMAVSTSSCVYCNIYSMKWYVPCTLLSRLVPLLVGLRCAQCAYRISTGKVCKAPQPTPPQVEGSWDFATLIVLILCTVLSGRDVIVDMFLLPVGIWCVWTLSNSCLH